MVSIADLNATATHPVVPTNGARPEVQADTIALAIMEGVRAKDTANTATKEAKANATGASEREELATLAFFGELGTNAALNRWQSADCAAAIVMVKNTIETSNSIAMDKKAADNFTGYVAKVLDPAARHLVAGFVTMSADAYGLSELDKERKKEFATKMRNAYGARYHYVAFLCKEAIGVAADVAGGKLAVLSDHYVPVDAADCRRMAGIKLTDRKYKIPSDTKALERILIALDAMDKDYVSTDLDAARAAIKKLDSKALGTGWDLKQERLSAERNADEVEKNRLALRVHGQKAAVAAAVREPELGLGELPAPTPETAPAASPAPLAGAFDPLSDPLIRQLMLGQQAMQMQLAALMDTIAAPTPAPAPAPAPRQRKAKDTPAT